MIRMSIPDHSDWDYDQLRDWLYTNVQYGFTIENGYIKFREESDAMIYMLRWL